MDMQVFPAFLQNSFDHILVPLIDLFLNMATALWTRLSVPPDFSSSLSERQQTAEPRTTSS